MFWASLDKWNNHSEQDHDYVMILEFSWGSKGHCDLMLWLLKDFFGGGVK